MVIKVTDELTTSELKDLFSNAYPHLKMEFFNHEHKFGEGSPKHCMIEKEVKISELRTKKEASEVIIEPNTQVGDIEKSFADLFGISVQIFRESGDVWLETSATDNWTLKKHQELAEERSTMGDAQD